MKCPKCHTNPTSTIEYKIGDEVYPKLINEKRLMTMEGVIHNWEEVHFCKNCKKEYKFKNGI